MKKVRYLDGLRGLAAFIVVLNHYVVAFYPALYNGSLDEVHIKGGIETVIAKTPFNIFYNGHLAVCIFFVLSGYVLTYKYFKMGDRNIIYSNGIRRYFRLSIPVIFSVLCVYLCIYFHCFYNVQAGEVTGSVWWLSTFWNFKPNIQDALYNGLYEVFFIGSGKYITVLWTMHYEFFGSFIVLATAAVFGKLKSRYFIYVLLACYFSKDEKGIHYLAFILGMILSDLNCNYKYYISKINTKFAVMILILGLYLGSYPTGIINAGGIYRVLKADTIGMICFYHIISAALIILALLCIKKMQHFLGNKTFIYLGNISFSMYLIHTIVLGSLSSYIFVKLNTILPYSLSFVIMFVISMPVILAISYHVYKHIDGAGVRISKRIYIMFNLFCISIKKLNKTEVAD